MSSREQIGEWIHWTQEYLAARGGYPTIDEEIPESPWLKSLSDFFDVDHGRLGLREECEKLVFGHSDFPARFTILNLYYHLSRWQYSAWNDLESSERRASFKSDLQYLAGLLPPEETGMDLQWIVWEVQTCLGIQHPQLAKDLFRRLDRLNLPDRRVLYLFRGTFHFLVVFEELPGTWLECLKWEPSRGKREDILRDVGLFWKTVPSIHANFIVSESRRESLFEAAKDLEFTLAEPNDFSVTYRSMLARCCFEKMDYGQAAENYQTVLATQTGKRVLDKMDIFTSEYEGDGGIRRALKESIAICYARNRDLASACHVLEAAAAEWPSAKGIFRRLADLQAEQTRFDLAYESLRKELQRDPEIYKEAGINLALALGERSDRTEGESLLKRIQESNPLNWRLIRSVLNSCWPAFRKMTPEAQDKWIGAHLIRERCINQDEFPPLVNEVVTGFAQAVEIELRAWTFEAFRQTVQQGEMNNLVSKNTNDDLKNLSKFLKTGKISLGQMIGVLKRSKQSHEDLLKQFGKWTSQNHPKLTNQLHVLEKINEVRNPAVHTSAKVELENFQELCRTFIDNWR